MRPYNLLVLAQGLASVPEPLLGAFEAQLSERDDPLDTIKEHEARSVTRLVDDLVAHGASTPRHFEGFAFSFRIPQISSEFDLLKICDGAVVDIELKIEDVGRERIERQLTRNRYYLAPLERTCYTFTYVADTGTLFEMDEDAVLAEVGIERLVGVLGLLGRPYEGRIEELFRASNYLVSPLNDTDRFLAGSYFLTNHQAQIKTSFIRACAEAQGTRPVVFLVYGSAGTGKSLLLYDLARSLELGGRTCVIHCGLLSEGHELLNRRQTAFRVMSAKGMEHQELDGYAAILVDEAQRLWPSQLARLVDLACERHVPLFLSLGRRQPLARDTSSAEVERAVRERCATASVWELSRRIRTNRELADFVGALFGLHGHTRFAHTACVKLGSAATPDAARALVATYQSEGYQHIATAGEVGSSAAQGEIVTPGSLGVSAVIGQEFDRVVMVIDARFRSADERYRQLLFQGLTRARDRIALVVLDDGELLGQLLQILEG